MTRNYCEYPECLRWTKKAMCIRCYRWVCPVHSVDLPVDGVALHVHCVCCARECGTLNVGVAPPNLALER